MSRRDIERAASGLTQVDLRPSGFGAKELLGVMLSVCEREPSMPLVFAVDALFEVLREKGSLTS